MSNHTWKPTSSDYLDAVLDQNPWNKLGRVPDVLAKPVPRLLAEVLWRSLNQDPIRHQLVLGPRRVGKTVVMYQTIDRLMKSGVPANRLWFLRLDHPLLMHYELGSWAKALIRRFGGGDGAPLYLFLDEINYSPQWDKWLKTFYDDRWPVRVVATSSSTAALRNRTIESGIGRWSEQYLTPYTFAEFLSLRGAEDPVASGAGDLFEAIRAVVESSPDVTPFNDRLLLYLLVGGFPELLDSLREDDKVSGLFRSQQVLRSEAVQRVAGMDIPQAFDIKNPLELERLLYMLAGQMCGLANISNLAKELGVSRLTAHRYIDYLEKAYLVFMLPNYSTNESSIQRKGRKVYFMDGAVRNAALQRGLAPLHDAAEQGYLRENTAAAHLHALALQSGARLFHWRDGESEVDLVYADPAGPIAFEIASGVNHSRKGLRSIQESFPQLANRCFLVSANSITYAMPSPERDGIGNIPLEAFLLLVGAQVRNAICRRLGVPELNASS